MSETGVFIGHLASSSQRCKPPFGVRIPGARTPWPRDDGASERDTSGQAGRSRGLARGGESLVEMPDSHRLRVGGFDPSVDVEGGPPVRVGPPSSPLPLAGAPAPLGSGDDGIAAAPIAPVRQASGPGDDRGCDAGASPVGGAVELEVADIANADQNPERPAALCESDGPVMTGGSRSARVVGPAPERLLSTARTERAPSPTERVRVPPRTRPKGLGVTRKLACERTHKGRNPMTKWGPGGESRPGPHGPSI